MDQYNLEIQWQMYLKRVSLDPAKVSEQQLSETKRAFMGAVGQMLALLAIDPFLLSTKKGVDKLKGMMDECKNFWLNEVKVHETKQHKFN